MRILVTAEYVSGKAEEGGSSRFMRLVADTLRDMGHSVVLTNRPWQLVNHHFDLIICSHNSILRQIKGHPAPKVCISQGIIGDEQFAHGADRYISISEEVRQDNLKRGIDSEVIGQPIDVWATGKPSVHLRKILIIRGVAAEGDPFVFLSEKYDVRISDMRYPIEEQIAWADLCIALGRGALEAMAQGKPVIVADHREYNKAALGDGYVTPELIGEMERANFSGRRFRIPITRAWLEAELRKYDPDHSEFLHRYVQEHHDARKIVSRYLEPIRAAKPSKISMGVMVNDPLRLDMVLKQSQIPKGIRCHTLENPESATKGINLLLGKCEADGADIAIIAHQDMYFRRGWIEQVESQLSRLPESWVVAGIIGKDADGIICGKFHDMRIPLDFDTSDIHQFPCPAVCFDEAVIIFNLKKGFRFDESMTGFDLYGTLCVLQTWEMGGTAWVIDAPAEHYCMRPFSWHPDQLFIGNYKMLHDRYSRRWTVDSTALGMSADPEEREVQKKAFMTSAAAYKGGF